MNKIDLNTYKKIKKVFEKDNLCIDCDFVGKDVDKKIQTYLEIGKKYKRKFLLLGEGNKNFDKHLKNEKQVSIEKANTIFDNLSKIEYNFDYTIDQIIQQDINNISFSERQEDMFYFNTGNVSNKIYFAEELAKKSKYTKNEILFGLLNLFEFKKGFSFEFLINEISNISKIDEMKLKVGGVELKEQKNKSGNFLFKNLLDSFVVGILGKDTFRINSSHLTTYFESLNKGKVEIENDKLYTITLKGKVIYFEGKDKDVALSQLLFSYLLRDLVGSHLELLGTIKLNNKKIINGEFKIESHYTSSYYLHQYFGGGELEMIEIIKDYTFYILKHVFEKGPEEITEMFGDIFTDYFIAEYIKYYNENNKAIHLECDRSEAYLNYLDLFYNEDKKIDKEKDVNYGKDVIFDFVLLKEVNSFFLEIEFKRVNFDIFLFELFSKNKIGERKSVYVTKFEYFSQIYKKIENRTKDALIEKTSKGVNCLSSIDDFFNFNTGFKSFSKRIMKEIENNVIEDILNSDNEYFLLKKNKINSRFLPSLVSKDNKEFSGDEYIIKKIGEINDLLYGNYFAVLSLGNFGTFFENLYEQTAANKSHFWNTEIHKIGTNKTNKSTDEKDNSDNTKPSIRNFLLKHQEMLIKKVFKKIDEISLHCFGKKIKLISKAFLSYKNESIFCGFAKRMDEYYSQTRNKTKFDKNNLFIFDGFCIERQEVSVGKNHNTKFLISPNCLKKFIVLSNDQNDDVHNNVFGFQFEGFHKYSFSKKGFSFSENKESYFELEKEEIKKSENEIQMKEFFESIKDDIDKKIKKGKLKECEILGYLDQVYYWYNIIDFFFYLGYLSLSEKIGNGKGQDVTLKTTKERYKKFLINTNENWYEDTQDIYKNKVKNYKIEFYQKEESEKLMFDKTDIFGKIKEHLLKQKTIGTTLNNIKEYKYKSYVELLEALFGIDKKNEQFFETLLNNIQSKGGKHLIIYGNQFNDTYYYFESEKFWTNREYEYYSFLKYIKENGNKYNIKHYSKKDKKLFSGKDKICFISLEDYYGNFLNNDIDIDGIYFYFPNYIKYGGPNKLTQGFENIINGDGIKNNLFNEIVKKYINCGTKEKENFTIGYISGTKENNILFLDKADKIYVDYNNKIKVTQTILNEKIKELDDSLFKKLKLDIKKGIKEGTIKGKNKGGIDEGSFDNIFNIIKEIINCYCLGVGKNNDMFGADDSFKPVKEDKNLYKVKNEVLDIIKTYF